MTPNELANGFAKLLLSQSDGNPETNLIVGIIERALLDAIGINDTTFPIHPRDLADGKRFLTDYRGRLCAELAGINPEWYQKHVNTYLQIALAETLTCATTQKRNPANPESDSLPRFNTTKPGEWTV